MAPKAKRRSSSASKPTRRSAPRTQSSSLWQRGKWLFIGGGLVGAIAILVVLTFAFSGPQARGVEIPVSSGPGSSAAVSASDLPDFPISLYQGSDIVGSKDVRFASLLGSKPIVLNYWASNCPPCTAEMPEFEKVWRKYKDRALFFGLDIGRFAGLGGPEDSKRALRHLGITYPAAPAPDIETLRRLQVRGLPSTDFITSDGKLHKRWVGVLSASKLTEIVEDLLNVPKTSRSELGEAVPTLPAAHSPPYVYNSRPPTSGNHLSATAPFGLSATPLQAEAVVHNMEHGGVVIWYQPGDAELADQVEALVTELGPKCLVAGPYSDMDYKVAVTAWGRLLGLSEFEADSIKAFVSAYRGELGPEAGLCWQQS